MLGYMVHHRLSKTIANGRSIPDQYKDVCKLFLQETFFPTGQSSDTFLNGISGHLRELAGFTRTVEAMSVAQSA